MKKYSVLVVLFAVSGCFGSQERIRRVVDHYGTVIHTTPTSNPTTIDLTKIFQQPNTTTPGYMHACFVVNSPIYGTYQESIWLTRNNELPTAATQANLLPVHYCVQDWVRSNAMRNIPGLRSAYWKKVSFDFFAGCLPLAVFLACKQLANENIALLTSLCSAGLACWMAASYRPRLAYGQNDEWVNRCKTDITTQASWFYTKNNATPQSLNHSFPEADNDTQLYISLYSEDSVEPSIGITDLNRNIWQQYSQNWNGKFKPALDAALDQQKPSGWGYGLGSLATIAGIACSNPAVQKAACNVWQARNRLF